METSKSILEIPKHTLGKIFGILGTININGGNYLVVISHSLCLGELVGAKIFRLEGVEMYPYDAE